MWLWWSTRRQARAPPLTQREPVLGAELCDAGLLVAPALRRDLQLQLAAGSLAGCSPQRRATLQGRHLQLAGALRLLERGLQRCQLLLGVEPGSLALSPEGICNSSTGQR